jgi:putative transposase
MARREIHDGEMYHIYNRGVDKRNVFMDNKDRSYFIHLLYAFNTPKQVTNTKRNYIKGNTSLLLPSAIDRGPTSINREKKKLVDIYAFVLMPNHFHLLIKQKNEDGLQKFMQKLGTGYTMYFNKKYERSGSLFQGKYKFVHIRHDSQLQYIPHYIHLNPLAIKPKNTTTPFTYLSSYKWSSLPDYIGKHNYPSVTERKYVLDYFGGKNKYTNELKEYIRGEKGFLACENNELIDFETK